MGDLIFLLTRFCLLYTSAFGTAGLRGIIGAGINRMNIYVVRKATQGLADYILEQGTDKKRVAIAFDSRHMSPEDVYKRQVNICSMINGMINLAKSLFENILFGTLSAFSISFPFFFLYLRLFFFV